jgi:hypothetical protein
MRSKNWKGNVMRKSFKKEIKRVYLEGNLLEVKNLIDELIEIHGASATLEETEQYYMYENTPDKYIALFKMVEETEAEMVVRIANETKLKQDQDKHDRALLEQLKKKLGEK